MRMMPKVDSPFPVEAFSDLAAIEVSHWWFRARNKLLLWIMATKVKPKTTYLEVGCGTGYVLQAVARAFPKLDLEATEYFSSGLSFAKQRVPSCRFHEMDACKMQDIDFYECIGCFDVLEHIRDDDKVLANFYRALKPKGTLILSLPQHQWLWSQSDDFAHHIRRYSRGDISRKLKKAGFHITYVNSFVSLLLPLMAIKRLQPSEKVLENFTVNDILGVNPALNKTLYALMLLELALLKLGIRFPAGGSIIVVARKP